MALNQSLSLPHRSKYATGGIAVERLQFAALILLAVALPLALRHPQILVGASVNFTLILAGIQMKGWRRLLPIILLPAPAALLGGYLFGGFTPALLTLLPLLWVGNATLVFVFKALYASRNGNYFTTLALGGGLKAGLIFAGASLLVAAGLIPATLLVPMGGLQLTTALLGGLFAYPVDRLLRRYSPDSE